MKQIIFLTGFLLTISQLFAAEFTEKQKAIIYNEAIKVLQSFEDLSNQMADAIVDADEANKLSQSIIDQFVNRKAIIYNDLDPSHKLSEAYELETYINNILLWYPDGLKFTFDLKTMKAGNIMDHGNEIFTVDIMTSKINNGNYLNRQKNENTEELLYRIAFFQTGNTFSNYKIAGVRSSKSTLVSNDANILAEVKSVEFSEKDMALIKDQTKALLNDYINFLNLLADPKETTEDKGYYRISFLGLFKDSTLSVANDIEPDAEKRWIPVAEYENNLVSSYPEGIRNLGLNLDSAQYGKVITEGTDKFYINGYIDKFFSGKYQDKTMHRDNAKYDFKVSFDRDENTFKNFKLSNIDKFGVNLYDQNNANTTQELPQLAITPLERTGFYFGASFSGGITHFTDPNLSSDPVLEWQITNKVAFSFDFNTTYYIMNQLGINAGLGFASYAANTSIDGEYQNLESSLLPPNNWEYYKNIDAAIDSSLTFGYLTIPITAIYHTNKKPEEWGFYAQVGLVTSFCIKSEYHITGDISKSGYFPNLLKDTIDLIYGDNEKWGFTTRSGIDESGKADIKGMNISALVSFGVSYPINYFTNIYAGPEMLWGLTTLYPKSNYYNLFGNETSAQKIGLSKIGIKFGISYKF